MNVVAVEVWSNYAEDVYRWSESECTLQMHRTIREVKDFNALFLNIYTSDIWTVLTEFIVAIQFSKQKAISCG